MHSSSFSLSFPQAKEHIISLIDAYATERIEFADQVIADHGANRISDGDVIMTYGRSHVVEKILKKAQDDGKRFRVVVVDSRPKLEGTSSHCVL